jgi:hypothetical protein
MTLADDGVASPGYSASAPADEYFGRLNESVLGIRNRLDAIDQKSDGDMLSRGAVTELDDLQDCIIALQQKYPNDPWLPRFLSRLSSDYARAGEASSPRALALAQIMQTGYSNVQVNHASNAVLGSVVADVDLPNVANAPINDPQIVDESSDVAYDQNDAAYDPSSDMLASDAWGTFNTSRGIATIDGDVVDASTGDPISGCTVFVAPNRESSDPSITPYSQTLEDGSFAVQHVPLARSEYVLVEPPEGSDYIAYHAVVDASEGVARTGVIRLTSE